MPTPPSTAPRSGWPLLWQAMRQQRRGIALGVAAGLVWTAAKVAVPTLTRLAVDYGIIESRPGELLRWSLCILGVGVVSATCVAFRRYLAFGIAYRAETDLRDRLFAHLQRLHFAFHDQAQTGQLMSRAATDLLQVQNFIVLIPITISNVVTLAAVTFILVRMNAGLALVALGALPLVNVFAKQFATKLHPVSLTLQQELAGLAGVVEETVTGIRVVKGFGAEPLQARRLRMWADRVWDQSVRLGRIRGLFNPLLDFLPTLGLVGVLWYGGHQVLAGHLTIGELVAFNTYVVMLIWPLRMLGQLIANAQRAVVSAQRIDEVLSTAPAIVDAPHAKAMPPGRGEVRFEAVTFGYVPVLPGVPPTGRPVVHHLDLVIKPGEAVALVGATGCGKTTLARLIPRFYDVLDGRVVIDGTDVRDIKLRELRRSVGIVFEDTFLFSDTIAANISFAQPGAPRDIVERAARLSGAHDFIVDFPDGYETVIGEQGFSLSGGQRQRIALARAIVADPRVLILDDATSSVDPTKEHEIREALAEVMRGRTTIVIAHRPATIALADRVVLLDDGRIIAQGTHDELLVTNERYREVLAREDAEEAAA